MIREAKKTRSENWRELRLVLVARGSTQGGEKGPGRRGTDVKKI